MSPRATVYQRGWVINSQHTGRPVHALGSISKGMGDQFSAGVSAKSVQLQYIKGDG